VVRSRVARVVGAVATVSAVVAGCSTPPTTAASAVGTHSQGQTQGVLTYRVKWQVDKGRIRVDGFNARFNTCHHVWIFFSKCSQSLVNPTVIFSIYVPPTRAGAPQTRLWIQTVTILRKRSVVASGTSWLPKGGPLTTTFPLGSYFSVQLYAYNNWSAVPLGGDQYYRVANANGGVILG
jgi:hypothetical protein